MKIIFTKISLTHHRLVCERDDGRREEIELETKSFIPHDFIHYAFEQQAGLKDSFWGMIACGRSFASFKMDNGVPMFSGMTNDEVAMTEMVTGALTGYLKNKNADPVEFIKRTREYLTQMGVTPPVFLTPDFLIVFKEDLRRLTGQWNALKKDEDMVLEW